MIVVNGIAVGYRPGMTVSEAVKEAGEAADSVTLVLVDGVVLNCGELYDKVLEDGADIKLLRIISGG